jgi:hypothetical protein
MSTDFDKARCEKRNRQAALRYGIDTASINFLTGPGQDAPVEMRNYGGSLPETTEEALKLINALLPEGADPLEASDVYIYYVEAANNDLIRDRYGFLGRDTLRNIAKDAAAGAAFMNTHRTGGLSTDAEFPFGKTFAGQFQEGRDSEGKPVQRALLGIYMLRGIKPNGDAGPSTDDLDRKIRGGTLFDVSVGLKEGWRECDVCGGDVNDYDSCPHVPGTLYAMDEDEIESQKARGVPDGRATYTYRKGQLGEISGVFDGAVRGAGFRKAMALSSKLTGENMKLAREVYGDFSMKEEGEGLLERVAEAVADGFRRAFGGKQPPTAEATQPEENVDMSKQNGADVEQLRRDSEELATLKQNQRDQAAAQFASDQVKTHKNLLPFGETKLKSLYLQLSADDASAPLAEGSRVEQLKGLFTALPGHHLTKELAAGQLPEGATVLENEDDPQQASVKQAAESARAYGEKANKTGPQPVR